MSRRIFGRREGSTVVSQTEPSMQQRCRSRRVRKMPFSEGKPQPKIDHEEFLEIADTWGYSEKTIQEIRAVIEQEDIGSGPFLARYKPNSKVAQMEAEARERFGVTHVHAVSSGTAALHSAYIAADIGAGDEVIVPGYTFAATAMPVVVAGGIPVWCEINESMTLDPSDLVNRITPRTKAIAPVHMNGYVCDMDAIMEIAERHGLLVVEDCAQSCGASFREQRVGTIGHLGCFSISSYKTTGGSEGGLVMTNDDDLYARVQQWAEAGGLWRPDRFGLSRWPGELFCGLNYRMSELEGSVDLIQMRKMDAQLDRWRANKRRIIEALPAYQELTPQIIHDVDGEMGHTIGFFAESGEESERAVSALRDVGISAGTRGTSARPDWHYFQHVEPIRERMSATSHGAPWHTPEAAAVDYSLNTCPKTVDLTSRHAHLTVDQWWTATDCKAVATTLMEVFDRLYTRDHEQDNWLTAATPAP
jgi:dTDP-4-amino-4,6-dideoxygalactose transaminase